MLKITRKEGMSKENLLKLALRLKQGQCSVEDIQNIMSGKGANQ